ncbi:MAG: hypothetical protein MH204_04530 [Fimbriimonadaceae bacterium]|nr:hypothetical protein [Fimbriimonadaceae bacterium]
MKTVLAHSLAMALVLSLGFASARWVLPATVAARAPVSPYTRPATEFEGNLDVQALTGIGQVIQDGTSPATLFILSSLTCSACRDRIPDLLVRAELQNPAPRVVVIHLTSPEDSNDLGKAQAVLAAARWNLAPWLYSSLLTGKVDWNRLTDDLSLKGISVSEFLAEMRTASITDQLDRARSWARQSAVPGTPVFLVHRPGLGFRQIQTSAELLPTILQE